MSLRAEIESALADGPLTGAQIRERLLQQVGSVALHRYLGTMRDRGYIGGRRGDVWRYCLRDYAWPANKPASAWDWRRAA